MEGRAWWAASTWLGMEDWERTQRALVCGHLLMDSAERHALQQACGHLQQNPDLAALRETAITVHRWGFLQPAPALSPTGPHLSAWCPPLQALSARRLLRALLAGDRGLWTNAPGGCTLEQQTFRYLGTVHWLLQNTKEAVGGWTLCPSTVAQASLLTLATPWDSWAALPQSQGSQLHPVSSGHLALHSRAT